MGRQGKLVIFSAPSGAGKTTIVRKVLAHIPQLVFSISATSRSKREGEESGKDYYFLSASEFKNRIQSEDFLEYEEVYDNQYYGTLKSEVERIWDSGKDVVFDVDVKGGLNIKKQFPKNSLSIFVQPPSVKELKLRLERRGTETAESLSRRVGKAEEEMTYASQFDSIIVNEKIDDAVEETLKILRPFLA